MAQETGGETFNAALRAYGVLSTSLAEALADARRAVAPHANLLAAGRMAELDELLAEFARRRVRVAIYGEVKAGKSTLINALSGAELSPVAFDPLTTVPVRITYGSRTQWRVGDLVFDDIRQLEGFMRNDAGRAAEVSVETRLDLLQLGGQVDLLDTPGVGSEQRLDAVSKEVLRSLDAVVLVVRYPALFTQMTRTLADALDRDIGKLFVVWNVDGACAELGEEERARHAQSLKERVGGAHDIYQVDARAAFRAVQAGDVAGIGASGLAKFQRALAEFAASEKRQLVALREAAKRADRWLSDAQGRLSAQEKYLRAEVGDIRARLEKVESEAAAKAEEERGRFARLQEAARRIGERRAAAAAEQAAELRKKLRAARGRWVRSGDINELSAAVAAAVAAYADAIDAACQSARAELQAAGQEFGTVIPSTPRPRAEPRVDALAPDDRVRRSNDGALRLLRRALWKRWYLPGLERLEGEVLEHDLAGQAAWYENAARGAEGAGQALLDLRLADIKRRADERLGEIKEATNYTALAAEFESLTRCLPIVVQRREAVGEIGKEARALM